MVSETEKQKVVAVGIDSFDERAATRQVVLVLGGLFLLNLLLRVFYLRYDFVNGDEGVRALSALRMLEGARLYADVVTDKPPGASFFYAAVFAAFGRTMKAIHLAAIVWNFATSLLVYLIAARFYGKRTALWAVLLFVYFSTNYFTQDMMAATTELLMALPYAAAFYFFMIAGVDPSKRMRAGSLLAAGVLTGVAALFKQVGVLNLGFFAIYEIWGAVRGDEAVRDSLMASLRKSIGRLLLIGSGFAAVVVLFALWLVRIGALQNFWRNAILLNMFYIDSEPANLWVRFFLGRGLGFVFFNATICVLAIWAVARSLKAASEHSHNQAEADTGKFPASTRFDLAVALWGAVTLAGVVMSGRFFGHYFIPALPALSLLAARGARLLGQRLSHSPRKVRWKIAVAALAVLFTIGLLRCHHRTAVLAYETITGSRTRWSANWGMTRRQEEAEVISAFVRSKIASGEPLYIWGYAHDVYWQTGCRPASRYLTSYYIDGRFVDAEATVAESGEELRREAAANLIEDLRLTQPRLILDVYSSILSLPYADLVDLIRTNYRDAGSIGPNPDRPFRVFELDPRAQAAQDR
jgi:4-amino-4-deoxy-L-arabinose transferase-like glycosyltransferase